MASRTTARPINHGRNASSAMLKPSAPTAPAMPKGRQHASVASALMAAATGDNRSVTRMSNQPGLLDLVPATRDEVGKAFRALFAGIERDHGLTGLIID